MSIATKAMVLNLQIGYWQGYRLDKAASEKVVKEAGANEDAARVNKHLIPKDKLKDVVSAASAVRNHFYEKTLPWKDNGDRLLTRAIYMDFMSEHGELVRKFEAAVQDFLELKYPTAIEQAEFRMGTLFNPADYPSTRELAHKFYVNLDVDAVTEAADFRVQLEQEEVERCTKAMQVALSDRLSRAVSDVWTRLADKLEHFATKLGDKDAVFRDTTITNLKDLVDMLPGLNITDDPRLTQLHQELRDRVCGYETKDLRKNPDVRAAVAGEAAEIMATMKGFMTAFGNGDE